MKRLKNQLMALGIILVITLGSSAWCYAQDVVKIMPAMHKLLLETEDVKVYEATYKPGEKAAMHSHPKHIIYLLSGGKMTMIGTDGKREELAMEAGVVRENPAVTHATENTGDTEVKVLVIELKNGMDHKMMPKKQN
ncbi:cupin domain-containing protein [Daejeonella oryzae]|uniref:cupin domain-containing protein n=1 Tax=Daejeonella oryzae TaxID=1122943 RepID=UPI00041F2A9B|nr:cupin domain-containing protein [Daejeonella oryzae]